MKKLLTYLTIITLGINSVCATQNDDNFGYVPRYDRGISGADYSERISFLNGVQQNRGGVVY